MAVILSIIVLASVIFLLWYGKFVHSRRNMYKLADLIPGLPHLPFIGIAHQFLRHNGDLFKFMIKVWKYNGENGISKLWFGPKLVIALNHPPSIEIVLNTALDKDIDYRFLKSWIGDGFVSAEPKIWRKHKKMLSSILNKKNLDGYIDIFAEQSNILVDKLSVETGKGQFDVFDYVISYTLDSICETSMGVKLKAQSNMNQSYIMAGREQMDIFMKRALQFWLKPQWLFNLTSYANAEKENLKILHEFSDSIVQQKRLEYKNRDKKVITDDSKTKDSLELMIEMNGDDYKFSDREIRENVDTLVTAGNGTTARAISYVLMMMGCLPHIQEKVVEELREIFGDSNRPLLKEDLSKMQYLERFIKETLRLLPIEPIFSRQLYEDVKLEKYILPAGAACIIDTWNIHRDKKIWGENALEFDPDRFLPENSVNRHPYAYMPFSGGMRDCIGKYYAMMSMKVLICTVLRSYKIQSTVDYKNIELKIEATLLPKHGHLISIERRNKL